eukprot:1395322-Alexandrium_andersonii.AAC.1
MCIRDSYCGNSGRGRAACSASRASTWPSFERRLDLHEGTTTTRPPRCKRLQRAASALSAR